MMKQDLVIVGGGVVGLSAAIAMCLRGFVVSVLDAGVLDGATLQPSARVYALNAASIDLLSQLGVFALIDTNAITPYRAMHVWDAMCGASIDFEAKVLDKYYDTQHIRLIYYSYLKDKFPKHAS